MNIMKNVGNTLDEKIKYGEINQSELLEESAELLKKLKNTAGMGDIQKLFSQMGIPGMGKGSKMNFNAMESELNKNAKHAKLRERIKKKLEAKRAQEELNKIIQESTTSTTATDNVTNLPYETRSVYSLGEKPEKTPRQNAPKTGKKNKNKKK
jgi:hypothetical protein